MFESYSVYAFKLVSLQVDHSMMKVMIQATAVDWQFWPDTVTQKTISMFDKFDLLLK